MAFPYYTGENIQFLGVPSYNS